MPACARCMAKCRYFPCAPASAAEPRHAACSASPRVTPLAHLLLHPTFLQAVQRQEDLQEEPILGDLDVVLPLELPPLSRTTAANTPASSPAAALMAGLMAGVQLPPQQSPLGASILRTFAGSPVAAALQGAAPAAGPVRPVAAPAQLGAGGMPPPLPLPGAPGAPGPALSPQAFAQMHAALQQHAMAMHMARSIPVSASTDSLARTACAACTADSHAPPVHGC